MKAPVVRKTYPGRRGKYQHRRCPYYTGDVTDRIPLAERTDHEDTEGRMDLISGPTGISTMYQCNSNECPVFTGNAVTEIQQSVNNLNITTSGQYIYTETFVTIPICSGIRFREF